jgi:hypothetical protein
LTVSTYYTDDEQTTDHADDDTDAHREQSPSTGWRGVCVALGVDPDLTGEPRDATTRAAVYDSERPRRNRRRHALGVTT